LLRLSIVTPCLNQASTLASTLESVLGQGYPNLEYIVCDGGSSDGSRAILQRYTGRLSWSSQPDSGPAQAINRGLAQATGQVMGWLNADDRYTSGTLAQVAQFFAQHPQVDLVYGLAYAIDSDGRRWGLRSHVRPCTLDDLRHQGNFIVQPAAFWRSTLWHRLGGLDERWRYVFDYDLWLRAARLTTLHHWPMPWAEECLHGDSLTARGGLARLDELEALGQAHGGAGTAAIYHAEAAALALRASLSAALRGHWPQAQQRAQQARRYGRSAPKIAAYLLTHALGGPALTMRARLWANTWRSRQRSGT